MSALRSPSDVRKQIVESRFEQPGVIKVVFTQLQSFLLAYQDNLKEFFSECYLPLMSAVFGFDQPGIIGMVANRPAECDLLIRFLGPDGPLFQAALDVDFEELNTYNMPVTRLPGHTQALLCTKAGVALVQRWPQYSATLAGVVGELDRISAQLAQQGLSPRQLPPGLLPPTSLQLPLSTSFLTVMVYASLLSVPSATRVPGARVAGGSGAPAPPPPLPHLAHAMTHTLEYFHAGRGRAAGDSPYTRLLSAYLTSLLPQGPPQAAHAHPGSHSAVRLGGRFLSVMLEVWLTDMDMPTPLASSASRRVSGTGTPRGTDAACVPYSAPSTLQVSCLKGLVSHLFVRGRGGSHGGGDGARAPAGPAQDSMWLPADVAGMSSTVADYPLQAPINTGNPKHQLAHLLGPPASPAVQTVLAHLYRFLRRAFLLWPTGQQQDALAAVVELWLTICFPWRQASAKYSLAWRNHVLSLLPFYHIVFTAFMELMLSTVRAAPDATLRLCTTVANAFKAEPELLGVLREAEAAIERHVARAPLPAAASTGANLAILVPLLAQQARGLERAALGGILGASQLPSLDAERMTFQLFLEGVTPSGEVPPSELGAPGRAADVLEILTSVLGPAKVSGLRSALGFLRPERFAPSAESLQPDFEYRLPTLGVDYGGPRHITASQVQYVGEYLLRPVASNELSCLAKPLGTWSIAWNKFLGISDCIRLKQLPGWWQKVVHVLHRRSVYVDLRIFAEVQSLIFCGLTFAVLQFFVSIFLPAPVTYAAVLSLYPCAMLAWIAFLFISEAGSSRR